LVANDFGQDSAFCQSCFDRALVAIATLTALCGEFTAAKRFGPLGFKGSTQEKRDTLFSVSAKESRK